MSQQDFYVLGINAYDHDVSACLLRNGEIAFGLFKVHSCERQVGLSLRKRW